MSLKRVLFLAACLAAAPRLASSAPANDVLAHQATKWKGVVAEATDFRRKGTILTARVRFRNQGDSDVKVAFAYSAVYLMDAAGGKKYTVLHDAGGSYIATGSGVSFAVNISPAGESSVWMKFPAPPKEVKVVMFQVDGVDPFEDLAIQDS